MEEKEGKEDNVENTNNTTVIVIEKSKLTEEIDFKPRQRTSKEPRKRRARRTTIELDQDYVSDHQEKDPEERSEEK